MIDIDEKIANIEKCKDNMWFTRDFSEKELMCRKTFKKMEKIIKYCAKKVVSKNVYSDLRCLIGFVIEWRGTSVQLLEWV